MSANRFGQIFSITSFGESHGEALGVAESRLRGGGDGEAKGDGESRRGENRERCSLHVDPCRRRRALPGARGDAGTRGGDGVEKRRGWGSAARDDRQSEAFEGRDSIGSSRHDGDVVIRNDASVRRRLQRELHDVVVGAEGRIGLDHADPIGKPVEGDADRTGAFMAPNGDRDFVRGSAGHRLVGGLDESQGRDALAVSGRR